MGHESSVNVEPTCSKCRKFLHNRLGGTCFPTSTVVAKNCASFALLSADDDVHQLLLL